MGAYIIKHRPHIKVGITTEKKRRRQTVNTGRDNFQRRSGPDDRRANIKTQHLSAEYQWEPCHELPTLQIHIPLTDIVKVKSHVPSPFKVCHLAKFSVCEVINGVAEKQRLLEERAQIMMRSMWNIHVRVRCRECSRYSNN